ncbi:MAG: hypothetical protein V1735_02205 [Nanoarchaeota archaeon]
MGLLAIVTSFDERQKAALRDGQAGLDWAKAKGHKAPSGNEYLSHFPIGNGDEGRLLIRKDDFTLEAIMEMDGLRGREFSRPDSHAFSVLDRLFSEEVLIGYQPPPTDQVLRLIMHPTTGWAVEFVRSEEDALGTPYHDPAQNDELHRPRPFSYFADLGSRKLLMNTGGLRLGQEASYKAIIDALLANDRAVYSRRALQAIIYRDIPEVTRYLNERIPPKKINKYQLTYPEGLPPIALDVDGHYSEDDLLRMTRHTPSAVAQWLKDLKQDETGRYQGSVFAERLLDLGRLDVLHRLGFTGDAEGLRQQPSR